VTRTPEAAAEYSFGDTSKPGVLLGFPLRQVMPVALGVAVATVAVMAGLMVVAVIAPVLGLLAAFGRWRGAPLFEVAVPGMRLALGGGRVGWTRRSLLAAGPGYELDLPGELAGIEVVEVGWEWAPSGVAVVRDRRAGTVSATVTATATGFAVSSRREQDGMLAGWGAALSPLARAGCPVVRVTWQEWSHPEGVAGHRQFLDRLAARRSGPHPDPTAAADYETLLDQQAPVTVAHDVTVTLSVDVGRARRRRHLSPLDAAVAALGEELRLFVARLQAAGIRVSEPLSPIELSCLVRLRSDPDRGRAEQLEGLRQSLAAAAGRGGIEWGPMAVESRWKTCRVDHSLHRTYRMASLPMLPVPADWLGPLLVGPAATRTVTMVLEPVPLGKAAAAANRELTSLEASDDDKMRRGFRVTARERRRRADVEARERELAQGHAEFRHVGFVTVTAADPDSLDDACAAVEQAAGQALVDLRPVAARQGAGWVVSLPLGRSVRGGR
jgi:hypothetical protein